MSNSLGQSIGSGKNTGNGAPFYIGRVKSIVLTPYLDASKTPNPDYASAADIGKIRFDRIYAMVTSTKTGDENGFAYPMTSFVKQYPLIGEIVAIFKGPSDDLNDSRDAQKMYYMPAYALWNAVNHNVMPNMAEMSQFYSKYTVNPGYGGSSGQAPEFPKGYTFTESGKVRSLTNFEGDSILEGRFGQSIRFGSTVTGFRGFNQWSDSGTNGDPITIIRNGQGSVTNELDKFASTVEDINTDGASIYMTAGQSITLEDIDNFPMRSYGNSSKQTQAISVTSVFEKPSSHDYTSAADQDQYILKT